MKHTHYRAIGLTVLCLFVAGMAYYHSIYAARMRESSSAQTRLLLAMDENQTGLLAVSKKDGKVTFASRAACQIFGFPNLEGISVGLLIPDWHSIQGTGVVDIKGQGVTVEGRRLYLFIRAFTTSTEHLAVINTGDEVKYHAIDPPE